MPLKYYAVSGGNGCGVYCDYDRVLKTKPFVTKFFTKAFKSRAEAERCSRERYNSVKSPELTPCVMDEFDKINWFYRENELMEIYKKRVAAEINPAAERL